MKRSIALIALGMMMSFARPVDVPAQPVWTMGDEFVILDRPSSDLYGFDFDGRFVAWRDNSGPDEEIYARDLSNMSKPLIKISDGPAGQKSLCRVSDGVVVWWRMTGGYVGEIYARDLVGRIWPESAEQHLITPVYGFSTLDISGDWIVFGQGHYGDPSGDLVAFNLRTGENFQIPEPDPNLPAQVNVKMDGNLVAFMTTLWYWEWLGYRDWDVYGYDLALRGMPFQIKVGAGQYQPTDVNGSRIVLQSIPFYSPPIERSISLIDLATGSEILVAEEVGNVGSVWRDFVLYQQVHQQWPTHQLYLYHLSSGERNLVCGEQTGDAVLANGVIVWQDFRPPASPGRALIYGRQIFGIANIITPGDLVTEATSPAGAEVTFTVTAEDLYGRPLPVTCVPPSGSIFPLGTTIVTATGTDAAGNTAIATFTITVRDTTPPSVLCPSDIVVPCATDLLVPVAFVASAVDVCDPEPTIEYSVQPGAGFPVGVTTVVCTASDASGNTASCSFQVIRNPLEFSGFSYPIGGSDATGGCFINPLRAFKAGSTIPIKFTASSGGVPVLNGIHRLQAIKYSDETTAGEPIDASPKDGASIGNQFRFVDGHWQFNLDTKATGLTPGIWQLVATLSDGSKHTAWIQIK